MRQKAILIMLLAVAVLASAEESRTVFSFKIGYSVPYSSTFNKEYVPAVNDELINTAEYLQGLGLSSSYLKMHKLSGLLLLGGEFEVKASQQFWLAFGSEFWTRSLNSALDVSGKIADVSYTVQEEGKINFYVVPILATIRINLPFEIARIYIGGGAGYYFGHLVLKQHWLWQEGSDTIDTGSRDLTATGRALLPHANLGGEVKISEKISVNLDLKYPFGSIKSFKVKKDTLDSQNVGQNLIFTDLNGAEKQFKWELSGPVIAAQLKFKF